MLDSFLLRISVVVLLISVHVAVSAAETLPSPNQRSEKTLNRVQNITISEAEEFVRSYYADSAEANINAVVDKFAEPADYDGGARTHAYIMQDLMADVKRWPNRYFAPEAILVLPAADGRVKVEFILIYSVADETTKKIGQISGDWILGRINGKLKIISLRETVRLPPTTSRVESPTPPEIRSQPGPRRVASSVPTIAEAQSTTHANSTHSTDAHTEVDIPTSKAKPKMPGSTPSPLSEPPVRKAIPIETGQKKNGLADFVVALDIGHTPLQGGAVSARGVFEYEFNRRLVSELFKQLQSSGMNRSFIINPAGKEISLYRRPAIANEQKADLFLAIHHDSVKDRFLKDWDYKGKTEKYCDDFHGYSIFYSRKNAKPEESLAFALKLGEALLKSGFTPTLHHVEQEHRPIVDKEKGVYAFDDLIVLKTATIPAVLLECGVIVNRKEEEDLNNAAYRKRLIGAVDQAIQDLALSETQKSH